MSEIITHYTGGEAFTQILLNHSIRFGDITCMNDYNETKHGVAEVFEQIRFSELDGIDRNVAIKMEENMKNAITYCEENQKGKFFSLSFSMDDDLLCMWNYYLKDNNKGGYNIGFNKEKFIDFLYTNVVSKIPKACLLHGEVIYKRSKDVPQIYNNVSNFIMPQLLQDDRMSNFALETIEDMSKETLFTNETERKHGFEKIKEFAYQSKNNVDEDSLPRVFARTDTGDVNFSLFVNYFIKGYGFRDEREYRIIIIIPTEQLDTQQKNRKTKEYDYGTVFANGMIKPFITVYFDKEAIEQIVISPYNSNRNPIKNTKEFCKNLGIDAKIKTSDLTVEF